MSALVATRAPLGRQLRSELRWIVRRPRTVIGLASLCLVPVLAGIGLWFAVDGDGPAGPGLAAIIAGNGLVLPVFTLFLALPLLLPLVGAIWAADGLAGEAQHGTLRGLMISPVGRLRLLGIKAFGVATMTLVAVTLIAFVGAITGVVLFGGEGMLTLSGSTLSFGAALGRIALTILLVTVQVWGVAAIAMAISACTEHPLVVMAATMAGVIVFAVLGVFSALDWLHPYLITSAWEGLTDVMRDPLPTEGLWRSTALAGCYVLIGLSLAAMRLATKDN
ncbi:ABC transporter permease subunit [Saccharothrix sp. 6-C]|uniref:ABC-2 type transport system permease protein n=1 Tax=Saccharothrix texasensis TaxID=103734 RepID=A0A3N1H7G2_9PSEU|nr:MULTISPECIES: ABC transporter permease [Saccharothrix]QQQ77190.1 ABC transporter permease subunit [Saccharothrix sp. 6-C]ROP38449.1 ABC-2 type transport system permease protein [Saccharothrix texasensis]